MGLNHLTIEVKAFFAITAGRRTKLGQNKLRENSNYCYHWSEIIVAVTIGELRRNSS